MNEEIFNSVMLSVISSPGAAGIVYNSGVFIGELMDAISHGEHKVQEHLVKLYGGDPVSAAGAIIRVCESSGVHIVTAWDDSYPILLREIHMPPLVLYCRGELTRGRHISIVGTRGSNSVSEEITRRIASSLVSRKITVTSGLALGVDRNAHLGALAAGGSTLAVLPQGIDVITPRANRDVYERILDTPGSAVISELPPGVRSGEPWVFVRRNRIISGISEALIITQAPLKSGAMITAKYALEQNRDLYVCPGNAFDETYSGCHSLIKQGAQIISGLEEFLCDIDPLYSAGENEQNDRGENVQLKVSMESGVTFNGTEKIVMQAALNAWADIDEIARINSVPAGEISRAVTSLEIAGNILRRGNRIRAV
ncbi:MAG TPA: DNA-processing protein DprA [Spirochaetota bacterium]|nr:DNA-processing protein DprA [Spirochaetota bacterium]